MSKRLTIDYDRYAGDLSFSTCRLRFSNCTIRYTKSYFAYYIYSSDRTLLEDYYLNIKLRSFIGATHSFKL